MSVYNEPPKNVVDKPVATGSGGPTKVLTADDIARLAPRVNCERCGTPGPVRYCTPNHCPCECHKTEHVPTPPASQPTVTLDRETFELMRDAIGEGLPFLRAAYGERDDLFGLKQAIDKGKLALLRAAEQK